ncbi:MAG: methyltransferase domain-containing protein [Methylobacteriaceae bacterium]|nr:methyltransferase domain-containing protein [Methylobacteriaceae bacterium]
MTNMGSSGDLQADRRFLYAEESAAAGDHAAAAELLEQCLEIAPDWAGAWLALGAARERLSDTEAAKRAYARALACDAEDVLGASLALARLGAAKAPATAAPAYVARLFDQYAPHFEEHLVDGLGYRAPALLRNAVVEVCARTDRPMRFGRALDLGCGTGLAGAAFRDRVDYLEGVDLSPGMLAQARAKSIYDALHIGEAEEQLRAVGTRSFDLILASDVVAYIGDLAAVFMQIARVLASAGLFAFTAESHNEEGYIVGDETRYAHSPKYIEATAREAGLPVLLLNAASTRRNKRVAVPGLICVMSA